VHRRWKWIDDSDDWVAFVAWRNAQAPAARVELEAGLDMLLDYGPEHDCYKIDNDLYVVYACCKHTVFWLLVGVAQPGRRSLLPLVWGIRPTQSVIDAAATEAARKLQKWRGST
jgi:hypothetical protein